jgi:hypothetical protein
VGMYKGTRRPRSSTSLPIIIAPAPAPAPVPWYEWFEYSLAG